MALIHLHGGGFRGGSKDTMGPQLTPITMRGYVSIALAYRLSGEAKWPAQMEDMKTVIVGRAPTPALWASTQSDHCGGLFGRWPSCAGGSGDPDTKLAACVGFYPVGPN